MNKKLTLSMTESDGEAVKKLAEKLEIPQVDIYRAAIKLILKMKVADQTALLTKKTKAKSAPKASN